MLKYIGIGLISYIVFVLYFFPASFAYNQLDSRVDNLPVTLKGVEGSIWSGKAQSLFAGNQQLDNFKWHFNPLKLLFARAEIAWEFEVKDGYGKGIAGSSLFGSTYVHNVEAWLPALDALSLVNLNSLRPGGSIAINLDELELSSGAVTALLGNITWHEAEISLLKPLKLGGLEVKFAPTVEGIVGEISDQGGPLEAKGKVVLTQDGKYDFNGTVAVRDASQTDLANALRSMGRPDNTGKIKLKQSGDLAQLGIF